VVKYCIYCGQESENGHAKECPVIGGAPPKVLGFERIKGDVEYNLMLGRFAILFTIRRLENKLISGPLDVNIRNRLVYEQIAFLIRRKHIKSEQLEHESKLNSCIGYSHKIKLKGIDTEIKELKKFAKHFLFPISKVDEILKSEENMISYSPDKKQAPVYRDSQTKELICLPIKKGRF